MDASLAGLVYVSSARGAFSKDALQELAIEAAQKNATQDITGFLFYESDTFLQYIEGSPREIDRLMARIAHDSRHTILRQLRDPQLAQRRFPSWRMRWLSGEKSVVLEEILTSLLKMEPEPGPNDVEVTARIWRLIEIIQEYHNLDDTEGYEEASPPPKS